MRRSLLGNPSEASSSYEAEYQAVLDYANANAITTPSTAQNIINNQLILDLKNAGAWSGFDLFYFFRQDCTAAFSKINWADPSNFYLTEVGTLTFTAEAGWERDGNNYLDTGYIPDTDAVNLGANDGSFIYKLNSAGGRQLIGGANNSSGRRVYMRKDATDNMFYRLLANTANITTIDIPYDMHEHIGTDASDRHTFVNGVLVDETSRIAGVLPTISVTIGQINGLTTTSNIGTFEYFALGSGLLAEQWDIYEAFNTALYDGLDLDYQKILDYADMRLYSKPSASQQILQSDFLKELKQSGVWNKLDVLFVNVTDAGKDFTSINWKNLSVTAEKEVTNVDWTSNVGNTKNASATDSMNYNPTTDGVNYTQDNACNFYKLGAQGISNIGTGDQVTRGTNLGVNVVSWFNGTNLQFRSNSTNAWIMPKATYGDIGDDNLFILVNRISANDVELFRNGVLVNSSNSNTSTGVPDADMFIGTSSGSYSNVMEIEGLGASLTSTEASDFYTAFNLYLAQI